MERFPICVIGAGPAGRNYIKALAKVWDIEVVGVTNRSEDPRRQVEAETGIPGFANLDELLRGVRVRPKVAVIATSNLTHKDFALECMAKGLDVFCEKPMAMTLDDCKTMLAAEKASGRILQIGFEYRYGSMTERLRELRDLGHFGRIVSVDCQDSRGHWWPDIPDAEPASVWRLNRAIGGGPIIHCGIHQLDLLRYYGGEITEVQAFVPPQALSFYPKDIPDHLTLHLRFASGAAGTLTLTHNFGATWYRPSPPHVPQYHKVPGHFMNVSIAGDQGAATAELYGEQLHVLRYDAANRETVLERTETFHHHSPARTHHDTPGMIVRFVRGLRAGKGAIHSAEDSYRTTVLGMICEEAVQEAIADGWRSQIRRIPA
jgi:predicted dehydrogenase